MFKILKQEKKINKNISNEDLIKLILLDHTRKKNFLIEKNLEEKISNSVEASFENVDIKIEDQKWEEEFFFNENKIKMKDIVTKELDELSINILSNQKSEREGIVVDRRKKKKN